MTSPADEQSTAQVNGALDAGVLLDVQDLKKYFPVHGGVLGRSVNQVRAVDGVSFWLQRGETLGLVGESGCGKSTTGRAVLRLIEPSGGRVFFDGQDLGGFDRAQFREFRRSAQIVFQDPYGSLNPRMTVGSMLAEILKVHGLGETGGHRSAGRAGATRTCSEFTAALRITKVLPMRTDEARVVLYMSAKHQILRPLRPRCSHRAKALGSRLSLIRTPS